MKKAPVIDVHVHAAFFEDALSGEGRLQAARDTMGLYKTWEYDIPGFVNQLGAAGVDKCCLLPLDLSASRGVQLGTTEEAVAMARKNPELFYAFASVDPARPDALEALEAAFAQPEVMGLKLHPVLQGFYADEERMNPIYELCQKKNKPILFAAGMCAAPKTPDKYGQPLRFERVAMDFPDLRICLAHVGWPWVSETAMLMLKCPNVYADLALLYFDNPAETYDRLFGVDMGRYWFERSFRHQLMFGSDEPRMEMIRMKKALDAMEMRDSTRELIMGRNALRFMGLEALSNDDS